MLARPDRLLALTTNPFALGAVPGTAIALGPAGRGLVVGLRVRMMPNRMPGRVYAVEALLSFAGRPFGLLTTGYLLDAVGGQTT